MSQPLDRSPDIVNSSDEKHHGQNFLSVLNDFAFRMSGTTCEDDVCRLVGETLRVIICKSDFLMIWLMPGSDSAMVTDFHLQSSCRAIPEGLQGRKLPLSEILLQIHMSEDLQNKGNGKIMPFRLSGDQSMTDTLLNRLFGPFQHPAGTEGLFSVGFKDGETTYGYLLIHAPAEYCRQGDMKEQWVLEVETIVNFATIHVGNLREKARVIGSISNFDSFFNTIDEMLFVIDMEGLIIHANQSVVDTLGYTREELKGMPVIDLHPSLHREEAALIIRKMIDDETGACPIPLISRDGHQIPVETRVTRGVWNSNPVLFGVSKNITQLKISEEKFSKVFHFHPLPMAISTIFDGVFIDVNESFISTTGYTRDAIIGKRGSELGIFYNTHQREEAIRIFKEQGSLRNFEIQVRFADGSVRDGIFFGEIIPIQGQDYILTLMQDITERKKMVEELKHNHEEMVNLNKSKDKFMSIIAHDLRGPFNAIYGFSEILASDIDTLETPVVREIASKLYRASDNYVKLLENLLMWARAQMGTLAFNPERIDVNQLFEKVYGMVESMASGKNIEVRFDIPAKAEITADLRMIETICRNLLMNAVKFTRNDGHVLVTVMMSDEYVEVIVHDDGIGMEPARLQNLFMIGRNISTAGTAHERGTGLGLILCRELIEKHHGKIWAESEPGKSSTFHFTIPQPMQEKSQ